ncbi:MAG: aspartate 1-decarboxylase [Clostridiales bacterium 43-6]|nr:MAG: aspartate 1-decarboxylase [Clostridiales bacterium 43-6]
MIEMMKSKIHRAVVKEANLNYVGSITIDEALVEASGMLPNQKVQVVNVTNGNRLETYVIHGERNSGMVCLNGAAAHLASPGDIIIIIAYCFLDETKAKDHKPKVVFVDGYNKIVNADITETAGQML